MTLHEEFYELEMGISESTDATDLTIIEYNDAMCNREAKQVFVSLELDVLHAMHRNQHVMLRNHKCELSHSCACNVGLVTNWLSDNVLPQWVVGADAAVDQVRTLFNA